VTDLAVRTQIIGADQIARVDLGLYDELVDVDRAGRFQRDLLELFLGGGSAGAIPRKGC
jgi:hypothetical protein